MTHAQIYFPVTIQFRDSPPHLNRGFSLRSFFAWNILFTSLMIPLSILLFRFLPYYDRYSNELMTALATLFGCMLVILFLAYFTIIFILKCLHNKSQDGWLLLLSFVPIINFLFIFHLILALGDRYTNPYATPHSLRAWENLLAVLYIIFIMLMTITIVIMPADLSALR